MIQDKTSIAAGAIPSDTYAKLIHQAYAKYRVSPAYSAQKEVLFPVLDLGGTARVPNKGDAGETRTEDVDTKHSSVWTSPLFDEVQIHLLESELQQGAELAEEHVADIRRLLLDV